MLPLRLRWLIRISPQGTHGGLSVYRMDVSRYIVLDQMVALVDRLTLTLLGRAGEKHEANQTRAEYSSLGTALTLSPTTAVHSFTFVQIIFFSKAVFPFLSSLVTPAARSYYFPGYPQVPFRPRQTFSPRQTRAGTSCTANKFVSSFRFTISYSLSSTSSARPLI